MSLAPTAALAAAIATNTVATPTAHPSALAAATAALTAPAPVHDRNLPGCSLLLLRPPRCAGGCAWVALRRHPT